jgi:hypothetical protein
MQGPQDVWSYQCEAILAEDGVTARRSRASSLTSLPVEQFPLAQGISAILGSHIFKVCTLESQTSLVLGVSRNLFILFVLFERKYRLSSSLVFYLRP